MKFHETLRFMKSEFEKENCNPETSVVATRQLWCWVPPWIYGLGLLMKYVCNILIYHPAKSLYSIMIWRCCSRLWMPRGSAPQASENINTQGWISLNVSTRNASNKSNEDGMHSLYSQPWQYPQRWDFDVTSIKQLEFSAVQVWIEPDLYQELHLIWMLFEIQKGLFPTDKYRLTPKLITSTILPLF